MKAYVHALLLKTMGKWPVLVSSDLYYHSQHLQRLQPSVTFIEHSSRNQGYGKKLIEHVENEAKSRETGLLPANISSRNIVSLGFHAKYGFLECGRFHKAGCKFNTPFDLVWMEKELV
jgi:L-amino acid N-acyltransferase YncA